MDRVLQELLAAAKRCPTCGVPTVDQIAHDLKYHPLFRCAWEADAALAQKGGA